MSESLTPPLHVTVTSFSYRKGVPVDTSEHGGGFVFDCRCLPNPGREERYRLMTGRDREVIAYLEANDEVRGFLEDVRSLVSRAVRSYKARGFAHLFIAFGCTGGQHRSVYFADTIARFLREELGVAVTLSHREQPQL